MVSECPFKLLIVLIPQIFLSDANAEWDKGWPVLSFISPSFRYQYLDIIPGTSETLAEIHQSLLFLTHRETFTFLQASKIPHYSI